MSDKDENKIVATVNADKFLNKPSYLKMDLVSSSLEAKRNFIFPTPIELTGWDRVKQMYQKDKFGTRSPEIHYVIQGAVVGGLTGIVGGGIAAGRRALNDFIRKNEATMFHGKLDGRRRLNDHVMLNSMRGAFHWGWRLASFTSIYLLTVSTISVYRDKSSIVEYTAAGGLTGALYKFNYGLKGMFAGGLVGSVLGTVAGSITLVSMWLTGVSMEEMRRYRRERLEQYQSEVHQQMLRKRKEDLDPITLAHDNSVGENS